MVKSIFKLKKIQMILAPGLIALGFLVLFIYQNCSREAQFKSRAGVKTDDPGNRPTDPSIGGNSDVRIDFRERPHDTTVDDPPPVVDYNVVPRDGLEVDVDCTLNGQPIDCDNTDRIVFDNLPPGPHEFVIIVSTEDNDGDGGDGGDGDGGDGGDGDGGDGGDGGGGRVIIITEVVEWVIYRRIVHMTKDLHVGQDVGAVDIIINIDNSGSMEYEQSSMSNRISSLITRIQELDYHIAVITTSPSDPQVWMDRLDYVDGKFVPFAPNVYCIRKGEYTSQQVRRMIQGAVVRDTALRDTMGNPIINPETGGIHSEGSGWERGIFTTYRAFERGIASDAPENANCLRTGVPKHVILISDERETMEDNLGNSLPDLYKSNGARLRELVARLYGSRVVFKFHSIIVNPYSEEGATCLSGHGGRSGIEYARLSMDTGGYIGSVCASDYGNQLGEIGTHVANSRLSYTLDCVVVSSNGDYGHVINISTGQAVSQEYFFRGDKVEFRTALDSGDYRVSYYCYN